LDYDELQDKLSNSDYNKANLNSSQLISFFITQKNLQNKAQSDPNIKSDADFLAFEQNFSKIQNDLKLFSQNKENFLKSSPLNENQKQVQVEDMRNLSDSNIQALTSNNDSLKSFT